MKLGVSQLRHPLPHLLYAKEVGFTRKDRVAYSLIRLRLYLYLPILQDLSTNYLLNRLDNEPPGLDLQDEWADSW
jgi:hypothetical protein